MRTRILIVAVIMTLTLVFSGCNSLTPTEKIEDWEFELLAQTYNTENELKKLNSGKLYSYQQEFLEQTRALKKYLEEKYPGHEFTITEFTPSNAASGNNQSYSFLVDGSETVFSAVVPDNTQTNFKDNYYAALFQPIYDDALTKELKRANIPVVVTHTKFTSPLGKEVDSSLTVETLFSIGSEIPRSTTIYINSTDHETMLIKVKNIINQIDLYGSYTVYCSNLFTDNLGVAECNEIQKVNSFITPEAFQHG